MNAQEHQFIPPSEPESSGRNGAPTPNSQSVQNFIADLPEVPTIAQRVKFFTARDTFIADLLPLEHVSAIKFDEWIAPLFKSIQQIDRTTWEIADKLWAINSALSQLEQRRANGQVYLRLDQMPDGKFLLTIVRP